MSQQNRSNGFRGEFFDKDVDKFVDKKAGIRFQATLRSLANTGCFSDLLAVYWADEYRQNGGQLGGKNEGLMTYSFT